MRAVENHILSNVETETETSQNENTRKYFNPMTEGVRWSEKYKESLEKFFLYLPSVVTKFIATLAIFTFGATLKGEWVILLVHSCKHFGFAAFSNGTDTNGTMDVSGLALTLANLKMENFTQFFIGSIVISYAFYFGIGGFLHWYFYVQRRDTAEEWKIQPNKWLSPELELHEIMVGCLALLFTGSYSAILACYIANGNPSTIYYTFDEYGWWWFFLQIPVIFIYQDYTTYILHRMYHTPFLYKHFHKLHHKYKQPTAFSVTAIHPVEIMHVQLTMCLPLFTIPTHWMSFYAVALYTYYHGIIDHSGINFKALWWQPWQPDADFHDKHHQFFHINFGFNIKFWDVLHGTVIKKNKYYDESTFHDDSPFVMTTTNEDEVLEKKEIIDVNGNLSMDTPQEARGKNVTHTNGHVKGE